MPQTPQAPADTQIPSLNEPGETLQIRERSTATGLVTFAASEGRGILVSVQANAPTETRARSFVAQYGATFGVNDQSQLRLARQPALDSLGVEHVRFQQQHNNVPVVAAEFLVHLRGSRVMAANGRMLPESRMPDTTPRIADAQAIVAARALIGRNRADQARGARYLTPRLEILNRGLLEDGTFPSHLAWFVEAVGPRLREYIWVDAHSGGVVLHFSQLAHARDRRIYDANDTNALPGTLRRTEGGLATGDAEEDGLYNMLGATYDYFFTQHARDSYDGAGSPIIGSVDWFEPGGCPNAFWDGSITQMAFCDGLVADDVVHHEFTHAVTEYTANLFYFNQSGALNESFSDIFGESIDLTDGIGNDTAPVRWAMGEDSSLGIIRNMMNPNLYDNPGKMTDVQFECDGNFDGGGVHINSGIPNHAYALMVDGGTYNGHTITGIGLTKAGRIQYRALSVYLSTGSTFLDNYNAVNQSCVDLIGTSGITVGDCTQVASALRAVEMNLKPMCANYVTPPPLCASGAAPTSTLFSDNFEIVPPTQWTVSSTTTTQWGFGNFWGDGQFHMFGPATESQSIHNLSMASSVVIPANARMHFEHAFFHDEFVGDYFDGGVIEYSTNGGATWNSAQTLIEAGRTYNGTLDPANPLGAVPAFVFDSYGFTGTRLNLSTLQGQSVRFRFRVSNDPIVAYFGWSVDNVQIYTCPGNADGNMVSNGDFANGGTPPAIHPANWFVFSTGTDVEWNTAGGTFNYRRPAGNTQGVILQQTGIPLPAFAGVQATLTVANTDPARRRFSVLIHDSDFSDLSVCTFWLDGSAPPRTYQLRTHTTKAWTNATISIYAASVGVGGFYQLDDVSMLTGPSLPISTEVTLCIDPMAPAAGGTSSAELIVDGAFNSGLALPWGTFGQISSQMNAGVFEFFKLAGTPGGVLLQRTSQAMTDNQKLRATFQLGNSSALRQRVTVLIHDEDFSDLHACTFIIPPGQALSTYAMRTYVTEAWANATIAFYPSTVGTAPSHQWLRLDNVSLIRTATITTGTECFEPGDVPAGPGFTGKR